MSPWARAAGLAEPLTAATALDLWLQALGNLATQPDDAVAVSVRVPYCAGRCFYCSDDVDVSFDAAAFDRHVDALLREMDLVVGRIGREREVTQLRLEGGTPNQLAAPQLARLARGLAERFRLCADTESSIRCDPRRTSATQLEMLRRLGFRQLVLDVVDLDPAVQRAVGRLQSAALVADVMDVARQVHFDRVEASVVVGLPLQTAPGLAASLGRLMALGPDRVWLRRFVHAPGEHPQQRLIDHDAVPDTDARDRLWHLAIDTLVEAGYEWIGANLLVLEDDPLALAARRGDLAYGALGHATVEARHLLGFGRGAVSEVAGTRVCTDPSRDGWHGALAAGLWPARVGHVRSAEARALRRASARLRCELALSDPGDQGALRSGVARMVAGAHDTWLEQRAGRWCVTPAGRYHLDEMCALLEGLARPRVSSPAPSALH